MREKGGRNVVDLGREPCCAVLALGLGGRTQAVFHSQYEVVEDGRAVPGPDPKKPPYEIPTMATIARKRGRAGVVASTFAGGGGSTTGYKMEGFDVRYACEFVDAAADTYEANHPIKVDRRDVRDVKPEEILEACRVERGELDVFDGSPPCEPFSSAGKRDRGWDGREDLFFQYARLVEGIQPKVFVAENVKGLVAGRAKGYFKAIHKRLTEAGYVVKAAMLDAKWLGVPQSRQRVILIGVRKDLDAEATFPKPLPYFYTVRDALPHLFKIIDPRERAYGEPSPLVDADEREAAAVTASGMGARLVGEMPEMVEADGRIQVSAEERQDVDRPSPARVAGRQTNVELEARHAPDKDGRANPRGHGRRRGPDDPAPAILAADDVRVVHDTHGHPNFNVEIRRGGDRIHEGFDPETEPSQTVTTRANRWHFVDNVERERRRLTIEELKAICGYPPDYVLTGSYGQQWERLGDGVRD
jgi:DNA (cytosine-5)-methyltransferase 1